MTLFEDEKSYTQEDFANITSGGILSMLLGREGIREFAVDSL